MSYSDGRKDEVNEKKPRWGDPMRHNLTELEAFDAMRVFLEAFWRRGGSRSEDLRNLLSWMNRAPWPSEKQHPSLRGAPLDLAQWQDWLKAIDEVKSKPEQPN
ncbi:MAG TPA: hypothetical protein VGK90_00970 [Rhizomicrobium sp.]